MYLIYIYLKLLILNLLTQQNQDSADMCSNLCFNWDTKIISQHNQCVFKTDKYNVS